MGDYVADTSPAVVTQSEPEEDAGITGVSP